MSLGGRDISTQNVVYGPDGTEYGNPAIARAAGVENPLNQPPVGVPSIPYGRAATPLNPALSPSDFEGSLLGPDLRVSNVQSAPQPIAPVIQPYTPAPQPIAPVIQPYTPAPQTIAPVIQPYTPAPQTIAPVIQQFNPMDEASAAVITYGPDGRAYGSPAEARNAGVSNPTMSPPAGVPISYPGRQPYTSAPMPYIPTPSSGGRNRYAEIMSQFGQSQPFSFFGMPSGGFNPYASDYTGGFTPYQRTFTPQPIVNPVEPTVPMVGGGGGGGRGMQEAPSAWSQMTPAERAAYYAANPTEGKIALGMQDLLGNATLMGQIGKYFGADNWYDSRLEKQGLDPESFAYGPPDPNFSSQAAAAARQEAQIAAVNAANLAGAGLVANPMAQDPAQRAQAVAEANARIAQQEAQSQARAVAEAQAQAVAEANARIAQQETPEQAIARENAESDARDRAHQAAIDASNASNRPSGRSGGAVSGGGGMLGNQSAATRSALRSNEGYGGLAKGGYVSMQHLGGPNPEGPDDGYAALKDGEFVINDKAVKKYGIELMNAINSGKISKGKLRGLLEM